ncbi:cupin domain-containing protein [Xylophilus sp. GOD-11R]|uniref:cupin domain-containing protein n=1 Tax=Xylophilus sp. GOD-11R TaxID=3089814 RepID=UPI00298C96EF|nr:cupin domain-containing protein [Xylophilus sp. GOD-11R]WPB58583.1 cupin domain-containing protein [Xylophilus sp. GOD-11R]
MKNTVIAFCAGVVVTLAGVTAYECIEHVDRMPDPSEASIALPLTGYNAPEARVISGTPNFRGTVYATSADGKTISGIWAADGPSTFDWTYVGDEAVYIQEGLAKVTYQGRTFELKPGESAFFHVGTVATWEVPQHVRKSWTVHGANRLVRWWRSVTEAL